jgi:hypothetical protein
MGMTIFWGSFKEGEKEKANLQRRVKIFFFPLSKPIFNVLNIPENVRVCSI